MSAKHPRARLHRSSSYHHPSSNPPQPRNIISPYISTSVSSNTQLHIFVDSVSRHRNNSSFAGYGVFAPYHSIRIAEPLPGSVQTSERAELRAFHAALELLHGIRARRAIIHVHSTFVVEIYNHRLHQWQHNQWRVSNPIFLRNRRLWQDVALLRSVFADRGVHLDVKSRKRRSDGQMKIAYRLAKHGSSLHVVCPLCQNTHGRQYIKHKCRPICFLDKCNGHVLKDVDAYTLHLHRNHRKTCDREDCEMDFECFTQQELDEHNREMHGRRTFSCDFCGKMYNTKKRAKKHMKSKCKSAPYCDDCGKRLTSKRDFAKHNVRRYSKDHTSSSDTESEDDHDERFTDTRARFDEFGLLDDHDESDSDNSSESSDESEQEPDKPGLFFTDKRGRKWEIDEYGLRHRVGQSASETFVPHRPELRP